MAPLPKRRHSTRRGGKRKAAIKLTLPSWIKCSNCSTLRPSHTVCPNCGYYDGKHVLVKREKKSKNPSAQ